MAKGELFKVDASEIQKLQLALQDAGRKTPQALRLALNRAGDMAFTAVRRHLSAEIGLKPAMLNGSKGLQKLPATVDARRMGYEIRAKSATTPLSYFNPVQTAAGVKANPWGTSRVFAGTFLVNLSSGHLGVFQRTQGQATYARRVSANGRVYYSQTNIRELWGPSLAKELGRAPTPAIFERTALANVGPRLTHEIERLMPRRAGQ